MPVAVATNSPLRAKLRALRIGERDRHRLERLAGEALARSARSSRRRSRSWHGCSGATVTPRAASNGTQAPSEPRRDQLAPPSASTTASALARTARPPAWRSARRRAAASCPAQPAVAHVELHAAPRAAGAARRATAARPSCRSGTRGPRCRRRSRCPGPAPRRAAARAERRAAAAASACAALADSARRRASKGFGVREVQAAPARPAGTCGPPRAWRRRRCTSHACGGAASRRPSGRRGRRRRRRLCIVVSARVMVRHRRVAAESWPRARHFAMAAIAAPAGHVATWFLSQCPAL